MKFWISAGILALTLNALLYGTNEVWNKDAYDSYDAYSTPGSTSGGTQMN